MMKKGLETELNRLEQEAEEFEKQVEAQDKYLAKISDDVDVFEEKIRDL